MLDIVFIAAALAFFGLSAGYAAICDRLVVMQAGCIVESGAADRVLSRPEHPFTRELLSHAPGGGRFR